jgi:osmotically-inducible protein OsmY
MVSRHADNSAINQADGAVALTPLSQGSGTADIQETARVRRAIIADRSMSIDAQNIKIITLNGRLTLRGTVDSVAEQQRIDALTRNTIGSQPLDDQLNVTQIK